MLAIASSSSYSTSCAVFPQVPEDVMRNEISKFLNGDDFLRCSGVSRDWNKYWSHEEFWQAECVRLDYVKNRGSRSRDKRTWKRVYQDNQCIECFDAGSVTMNIAQFVEKPALCVR